MEYGTITDLIRALETGTKLHVSVLYFTPVPQALCPDRKHQIHSTPFCDAAKERPRGLIHCMKCKKYVTEKVRRTGQPLGGVCINGLYEYTLPIRADGTLIGIVSVGNLITDEEVFRRKNAGYDVDALARLPERNCTAEDCRRAAEITDSYIRLLYGALPAAPEEKTGYLVRTLKEYADANFMYDVRLSQLSELFHYNEKYIGRVFKKEVGIPFCRYVNRRRLDYAKQQLRTTSEPVIEIALSAGFNNVTYFNRLFRDAFGVTPGEYRENR